MAQDVYKRQVTDTIKNLYDMMRSYELDVAIVDGQFPASGYTLSLIHI